MITKKISDDALIVGRVIMDNEKSFYTRYKKNHRIEFKNNHNIYYLLSGSATFYRYSDDVVTITKQAPFMLGVAQMRSTFKTHYVRCDSECEMYGIPIEDACIIFGKNFLWEHVFNILTEQIQEYFKREHMVFHKSADSIVEHHLKHLWEMDDELRNRTSIYKFILDRNHISRSAIHKVVKKMVESGTIKVSHGRLLSYNTESSS